MATIDTGLFTYEALKSPQSIRLARLLPSENSGDPIQIELVEISPEELNYEQEGDPRNRPSYEALSYVWGAVEGNTYAACHGKVIKVTPNCLSALRHLRSNSDPECYGSMRFA